MVVRVGIGDTAGYAVVVGVAVGVERAGAVRVRVRGGGAAVYVVGVFVVGDAGVEAVVVYVCCGCK